MAEFINFEHGDKEVMVNIAQLPYAEIDNTNSQVTLKVILPSENAGYRHFGLTGSIAVDVISQLERFKQRK